MHNDYRDAGLRVFTLWPMNDGKCTCGDPDCEAAGKHPRASNWQHTPEWSDEQIDNFERFGWFLDGFGVLCRGLLVIDVDERNGGAEGLEKLLADYPDVAGCGFIVRTGSGGASRHYYFRAPDGVALLGKLDGYPGIDFKSSGYVVGAGSKHKSGGTYDAVIGGPDDIEDAPADLISALTRPERHRTDFNGRSVDVSHSDIADMLKHISADCDYDKWIRCGMAVHHASGGSGFAVWDDWSQSGGDRYDASGMDSHWQSFGKSANPVTLGTLVHYAEQGGWIAPVTFGGEPPKFEFSDAAPQDVPRDDDASAAPVVSAMSSDLPIDLAGVDLGRPPGFVGEVAAWVEAQSRRPRRLIAAATAIHSLGNVFGLRYTDDRDGVTSNMFSFCVAGSRTGKESIQQAGGVIHEAAGMSAAVHGGIKSEQEIMRNLTRHQAAFYLVDEVGILLQKIQNAQKKGGAVYLDGVIGLLMSAYSKGDGWLPMSGDAKEDLRGALEKQLSAVVRRIDENETRPGDEAQRDALLRTLGGLDRGLERPMLSLMGFTTPSTFESLVDFQSATNGFIGRALIYNERNTAPRTKSSFRARKKRDRVKPPMPDAMAMTIAQLASGGHYDQTVQRVEYYGDRIEIPTTDDAHDALDAVLDWFEDQAEAQTESSGLEALYLGAYELVAKISLTMGVPEGIRTLEHVRYAFALVRQDVRDKLTLVVANDSEKADPAMALAARIVSICGGKNGETPGVIRNRLAKKFRKDDVDAAIKQLVEAGKLERLEPRKEGQGRKSERYRRI